MQWINTSYFYIYLALVRRNMYVVKERLKSRLINAAIRVVSNVIEYGGFLPMMGVPIQLIAPLFVGSIGMQILFQGYSLAYRTVSDIRHSRYIDYEMTLPLPKRWLFAAHITYFCIEAAIITLPVFTVGVFLLGTKFQIVSTHWLLFFAMYLISLIFFGIMFLGLGFYYPYYWFMQNIWPRRLTFLLLLSPTFFVWKKVFSFAPNAAYIMLAVPLTYVVEGLRATFIGGSEYLPVYICLPALLIWIALAIGFAAHGIKKRLDPV